MTCRFSKRQSTGLGLAVVKGRAFNIYLFCRMPDWIVICNGFKANVVEEHETAGCNGNRIELEIYISSISTTFNW